MSIKQTYTTTNNEVKYVLLENDIEKIDISNKMIKLIDLSPLRSCTCLQELILRENQLQTIDLSSLAPCATLQNLDLSSNQLQSIDLSPLSSCASLQSLALDRNELQSIDLAPLEICSGLSFLGLAQNNLDSIDFYPLGPRILQVNLNENPIETLDITPITGSYVSDDARFRTSWLNTGTYRETASEGDPTENEDQSNLLTALYHNASYERPQRLCHWSFLQKIIDKAMSDRRIQLDFLYAMGLGDYGFVDKDLKDTFHAMKQARSRESAVNQITPILLEEIQSAVEAGGITIGLNLESLGTKHHEIALLTSEIIQLRAKELRTLKVKNDGRIYDLKELWLTAYGYEVLRNMDVGLSVGIQGFERIMHVFSDMGFDLKCGERSSGVKISDELREVIWWIVRNRRRSWMDINPEKIKDSCTGKFLN